MHNLISLKELRTQLTKFTKRVSEKGDSFIVLKKSKPVFKIVPIEDDSWETVADFTKLDTKGIPLEKAKKALEELLAEK